MRPWVGTTVAAALVGAALVGLSTSPLAGQAAADPAGPTLTELTSQLATVTAHAEALSVQLDGAAAQGGGVRVALERAESAHQEAQGQLDSRARSLYMTQQVDPLGGWQAGLASPDLRNLVHRGEVASLRVDQSLIAVVSGQQSQLRVLRARAEAFHVRLLNQATAVLADQDRARALLARATALAQAEYVAAQRAAEQQRLAAVQQQLAAQAAALDAVSATVTLALTPEQSARSRAAAASQAPVVGLLEASGSALPRGYLPSGQSFSGTASWYGPGFVGRPTASGAPYDPERLTCANKEVPLGTVLRVSANGRSVSCLVNDRGPYVGDRVLDLSRAGSRALGYDGLAEVTVEVLLSG